MTTYASNASLVTRIALANAPANVAEAVGAYISDVLKGMGHDRSNTYGPAMAPDDGRIVTNFLTQALDSLPLTPYGDGTQTRSFCYVDGLIVRQTRS